MEVVGFVYGRAEKLAAFDRIYFNSRIPQNLSNYSQKKTPQIGFRDSFPDHLSYLAYHIYPSLRLHISPIYSRSRWINIRCRSISRRWILWYTRRFCFCMAFMMCVGLKSVTGKMNPLVESFSLSSLIRWSGILSCLNISFLLTNQSSPPH